MSQTTVINIHEKGFLQGQGQFGSQNLEVSQFY